MTESGSPVGTFTVDVTIADHIRPERTRTIREVMVDTGSDATWISAGILEELGIRRVKRDIIEYANGLQAIRTIGYAIVRVGNRETIDEVVFGTWRSSAARVSSARGPWPHGRSPQQSAHRPGAQVGDGRVAVS